MNEGKQALAETYGTVLYIEDQELNTLLVESQLAALLPRVRLIKAFTGAEGVKLVRLEHPDLVLLDMHLPDVSGLEVVRALTLEISEGLKVALLTSDHLSMDILKAMSLGAYEYWTKPISSTQLEKGVRRALASKMPADAEGPLPSAMTDANYKRSY